MAYQRKTKDEYEVQQCIYGEWSMVTTEDTFKDAKVQAKSYRENQSEYPVRIVKIRVKL